MRIMIADDSAVVRTIISQGFAKNKDIGPYMPEMRYQKRQLNNRLHLNTVIHSRNKPTFAFR